MALRICRRGFSCLPECGFVFLSTALRGCRQGFSCFPECGFVVLVWRLRVCRRGFSCLPECGCVVLVWRCVAVILLPAWRMPRRRAGHVRQSVRFPASIQPVAARQTAGGGGQSGSVPRGAAFQLAGAGAGLAWPCPGLGAVLRSLGPGAACPARWKTKMPTTCMQAIGILLRALQDGLEPTTP